jgi:hypothetical protein
VKPLAKRRPYGRSVEHSSREKKKSKADILKEIERIRDVTVASRCSINSKRWKDAVARCVALRRQIKGV